MSTRGKAWAAQVRDAYVLNEGQDVEVDIVADTMDAIAALPASDVVERRQQRLVLLRALSQLALPDADGGVTSTATVSAKARKAARARWDRQRGA